MKEFYIRNPFTGLVELPVFRCDFDVPLTIDSLKNPSQLIERTQNNMTHKTVMDTIRQVIFNPPATIVIWRDGSKTVVKCGENDIFDPEKGLAMAISKRAFGDNRDYYEIFAKWVGKYEYQQKKKEKK